MNSYHMWTLVVDGFFEKSVKRMRLNVTSKIVEKTDCVVKEEKKETQKLHVCRFELEGK